MLQKPDVHTAELLELANFIDDLEPERFDMGTFGTYEEPRCICGWYQHNHGHVNKSDWSAAGKALGLTDHVAHRLFHYGTGSMDNKQAAKVLRHLAVTGELLPA
jgi:hypothetical protein